MTAPTTIKHPRQLVQGADLTDLVVAYVTGLRHPFSFVEIDGEAHFVCPKCSHATINGGTAKVVSAWQWACHWCRYKGTRYVFERLVLKDADMLAALYEWDGAQ